MSDQGSGDEQPSSSKSSVPCWGLEGPAEAMRLRRGTHDLDYPL